MLIKISFSKEYESKSSRQMLQSNAGKESFNGTLDQDQSRNQLVQRTKEKRHRLHSYFISNLSNKFNKLNPAKNNPTLVSSQKVNHPKRNLTTVPKNKFERIKQRDMFRMIILYD